jgi:multiple sugar transport system substrate-binding protein
MKNKISGAVGRRNSGSFSRRNVLKGTGTLGLAAAASSLPFGTASAQEATLRWWSPQSSPAQLAAYKYQIATFEKAHPGIKVKFEKTSDEGYAPQLAAAFASGKVPNMVTHLPSFACSNYWRNGLLEPMNDVIDAVGTEKYYDGANDIYEIDKGQYSATGIGNSAANMLWLRKDLLEKAGIDKTPETFDELRNACQKMQGGGVYGAPLPYAKNSMTTLTIIGFIHLAGGHVFNPDLEVDMVTDEAVNALEFYRSMRELCPPGATNYSWGESLTAFVSGGTATGIYTGRVLINVNNQNPKIADHVTCATYPRISRDVAPWTFNAFPSVFIPKAAPHMEETKKLAAWLFNADGYIKQMHGAPGHLLPVLKTIADDPRYQDNDIIKKYPAEVEKMSQSAAAGKNLGWETTAHKTNDKAGAVVNSGVLAELVQRVVLNNEDPKETLKDTAKKIEAIMKG